MFRTKTLSIIALAALLSVAAACADVSGPSPVCPIGGGPGTCPGVTN